MPLPPSNKSCFFPDSPCYEVSQNESLLRARNHLEILKVSPRLKNVINFSNLDFFFSAMLTCDIDQRKYQEASVLVNNTSVNRHQKANQGPSCF
jgi:hypothetical protein